MAYSAFLSLFHPQYQVLCTCLRWSLQVSVLSFPQLQWIQICTILSKDKPMLWPYRHSQSIPCAISPSGLQLTVPAPAIWPRTASAELANILKLTTWSLPETVVHTVGSISKLIREKKEKKESNPARFMELLGPPTNLQNQTTTKCWSLKVQIKGFNGNSSYLFHLCAHELQWTKLHLTEFCAISPKLR